MSTKWQNIGVTNAKEIAIIRKAAALDPKFAAKMGLVVGAFTDYVVTGFTFSNWAKSPKPGDDVFVDVVGEVFDQYAGYPDNWTICVAVAAVDGAGKPIETLKTYKLFTSEVQGKKYPYDNIIVITDSPFTLPWHHHAVIGKMPNNAINVWAELFASHEGSPTWNWTSWLQQW